MSQRYRPGVFLALFLTMILAACGANASSAGASTPGGSTTASTSTAATPTTPPKTKPSAIPTTTVALCEGWLSFAEANQIVKPPASITNVVPGNSADASSCQYENASGKFPLVLTFEAFPAGTQLSTFASEAAAKNYAGATVTTSHAVNGVGDQAWFLAGSLSSDGINAHADALYVADGGVVIIISNLNYNGASPIGSSDDATVQSEFAQLGNLITSRL
jgi:hypothetical protein